MVRSEIDALKILHNIHVLRAQFGNGVKFCAVLKGNAYGCGAEMIAHLLEAATAVDCIAVATLEEGVPAPGDRDQAADPCFERCC